MIISTERFYLKALTENDVTENYLSWFGSSKEVFKYISYSKTNSSIDSLRKYVKERESKDDVLFLGIFTHLGIHIGNIKYEPIDIKNNSATMGILIGDTEWRGKGVAIEVIKASSKYLRNHYNIQYVELGVHRDNLAAISAYKKINFRIIKETDDIFLMRLNLV